MVALETLRRLPGEATSPQQYMWGEYLAYIGYASVLVALVTVALSAAGSAQQSSASPPVRATVAVDLGAPGVAREDGDFPLAWYRDYGKGRVFYTALGHPDETWLDERFQTLLLNALRWLGGDD